MTGLTSIILPTYNRAAFLPGAIGSIAAQKSADWELIVVDDGSTDGTASIVTSLCRDFANRVRYVRQENQGAYPARNTGLGLAIGEYVAFFDSDDLWLPHHLDQCVTALSTHADVDWVYGACQILNVRTGEELAPNTFYEGGRTTLNGVELPAKWTGRVAAGDIIGIETPGGGGWGHPLPQITV